MAAMIGGPLELSLGDVFDDVSTAPLRNADARAAKAWEDAAGALARDPALALSPLHFLRRHRFQLPPYPRTAVVTLMNAMRRAEDAAATSPSLAGEIWSTAAIILGAWARWRSTQHVGGTVEARRTPRDSCASSASVPTKTSPRRAQKPTTVGAATTNAPPLSPHRRRMRTRTRMRK